MVETELRLREGEHCIAHSMSSDKDNQIATNFENSVTDVRSDATLPKQQDGDEHLEMNLSGVGKNLQLVQLNSDNTIAQSHAQNSSDKKHKFGQHAPSFSISPESIVITQHKKKEKTLPLDYGIADYGNNMLQLNQDLFSRNEENGKVTLACY